VKPQPTFSPLGSSDIVGLAPSKFLAPSSQSFELRFQCEPTGFQNQIVIRHLIPCTRSTTSGCCRLLARLHLRSQRPVTFRLSSFATGPCSIGTLGLISRPNQPCDWLFSDKTADSNRRFRHPPPFEDFRFETQARAIQRAILLGLRAYRQPEKPTQRLGTLSCLRLGVCIGNRS
jgi:hypothetical protein